MRMPRRSDFCPCPGGSGCKNAVKAARDEVYWAQPDVRACGPAEQARGVFADASYRYRERLYHAKGHDAMDVEDVMRELRRIANPKSKRDYQNHGANDDIFGVSVTELRRLSGKIGPNHELSIKLYDSGNFDAMHLSAMIAEPRRLSEDTLNSMVNRAYCHVLADYVVASVTTEQDMPLAAKLAAAWIMSNRDMIQTASWSTLSMLLRIHQDHEFSKPEMQQYLDLARGSFAGASDYVKNAMNQFIIAAGTAYAPLREEAYAVAKQIGSVTIRHSNTRGKILHPASDIERIHAKGHSGKKRTSFR